MAERKNNLPRDERSGGLYEMQTGAYEIRKRKMADNANHHPLMLKWAEMEAFSSLVACRNQGIGALFKQQRCPHFVFLMATVTLGQKPRRAH